MDLHPGKGIYFSAPKWKKGRPICPSPAPAQMVTEAASSVYRASPSRPRGQGSLLMGELGPHEQRFIPYQSDH